MDKVISTTLKVVAVLLGIWIVYALRNIIAYFLFAFIIASALRPGIDFLEKKKVPRIVSGIFIFVLFLALVVLVFTLVLPSLIREVNNFLNSSPEISQNFINVIKRIEGTMKINLLDSIKGSFSTVLQGLGKSFTSAFGVISKFFGGLFNAMFIIIISFYFSVEKKTAERVSKLIASGNKHNEKKILDAWKRAENIAGRWLFSYLILGTIVGFLVYIGLSLIGVRYALVLAVLAGVLEIIPLLGPILAGAIGAVLTLLQGGVLLAVWTVLIFIVVQQLENFLIVPLVMKKRIDLHPILVIVVIFVASKVFGALGAILSIPIVATIIALVKENYSDYFIERKVKPFFSKRS